ncbi:hypothetical protein BKA69DRAFT_1123235 [Paraphysoderma sedebokerense]|nr:hypothetical protein BKA69DRAFT_1123235 [Paraphysoderma sedebokerense]
MASLPQFALLNFAVAALRDTGLLDDLVLQLSSGVSILRPDGKLKFTAPIVNMESNTTLMNISAAPDETSSIPVISTDLRLQIQRSEQTLIGRLSALIIFSVANLINSYFKSEISIPKLGDKNIQDRLRFELIAWTAFATILTILAARILSVYVFNIKIRRLRAISGKFKNPDMEIQTPMLFITKLWGKKQFTSYVTLGVMFHVYGAIVA